MNLELLKTDFASTAFPEPEWKSHVERWYQLDAPAFMLCESYWQNKTRLDTPPELVVINSAQASYATDQLFCKTLSPSKFVHTLPSVRTSSLFQLLEWRGPSISFVDDHEKIRRHCEELVEKSLYSRIWFLHIEESPQLSVHWYVITAETKA